MKRLRWEAALIGFVALAATLAAAERTPLTWDEGDAFVRAERVAAWTRAVVVGPQKLREAFRGSDAKSERKADSNVFAEKTGGEANRDVGANRAGTPEKSPPTPPLNVNDGAKEASERRERPERPRFGDVERAALEYFARFDGRRALFSEKAIEAGWPHVVYREGHPAGYSVAIAAGRAFSLRFLPFLSEKAAFRLGPISLWAAALAAVFYRVGRNWGRFAAILAVVGIASIPRVFGHAQLAGGDSLLISSWLLAWAFFDAALASKRGAVALGAAVGVSFCAKFSGFAVAVPLTAAFVATLWTRRQDGLRVLGKTRGLGGVKKKGEMENLKNASEKRRDGALATTGRFALAAAVATAVFFAANPPLWTRPFAGFETFVSLNLRRDGFDIPIYFLGKIYSPSRPLPWWNGFFWLATTVPTALLAFAALGSVATAFRKIGGNNAIEEAGEVGGLGGNGADPTAARKGNEEDKEGKEGKEREEKIAGIERMAGIEVGRRKEEDEGKEAEKGEEGKEEKEEKEGEIREEGERGKEGKAAGRREGSEKNGGERRGRRLVGLALALAATLPLVRVIPGIPTHDGARLLIASFPFIAILAAFGATVFIERCGELGGRVRRIGKNCESGENKEDWEKWKAEKLENIGQSERRETRREGEKKEKKGERTARRLAQLAVATAFAVGVVDLARSAPQYLSFYNATLGGVVGAQRRGMEATYYWDAFDGETVAWLNAKIAAARADGRPSGVLFGSFSTQTLDYYRRWGTLASPDIATISDSNAFANGGRFGFYVVQRRPSGWSALDLALFRAARPIYRKTIGDPFDFRAKKDSRREAVLLEIYDFRDVERVLTAAARSQRGNGKMETR